MKLKIAFLLTLGSAAFAHAQQNQSGNNASPYAPNYFNRNTQPLSPYLNLLRGGNPAVNYFYGVQPGVMGGPFRSPLGAQSGGQSGRQTFFPQVDNLYEAEGVGPLDGLRPSGHMSGFNNTLNYFGGTGSMQQRPQQGGGSLMPRTSGGSNIR